MATFSIPPEFQDKLEPIELRDQRSDDEILQSLNKYVPVTTEKNIWAFWHSGILDMPAWCQRNVIDWVRICGPEWDVRVLDNVPESPNYALKYISSDLLPEAFVQRNMDGPYVGPHSADFLRGSCLYLYGGAFMDVGSILLRHMDRIGWKELEDPNSPYQIAIPLMYGLHIANHFVAARKGDPFIKRWHDLFINLWKGHTNHEGLLQNPLINSFGAGLSFDEARASKFNWEFKVSPTTVAEYISQVFAWVRLCTLEDAGDGFSCTDYWQNNILCFDTLKEDWLAEDIIGFDAQKIFDLLTLSREGDNTTEQYKEAEKLVWGLLSEGAMQKVTHGKGLTTAISLGTLLDLPENLGKDQAPGTFAELLRYGSVHFRQKREQLVLMEAQKPAKTFRKGVLEP
ncbi:hypothetical protein BX600DRAFT_529397 [Xylariales sp. PMI_506]|nr:hypothetical protein BX600DRAFT_529397 [Xylariales sp. PMI_506]